MENHNNILSSYPRIKNLFGLIGYPLSHSFSKQYFGNKFGKENITDCYYELFPIESIDSFKTLWENHPNLKGLNVTIPYKQKVIPFLDEIDDGAKAVGAVNTIKRQAGKLIGFNTDVYGFEESLLFFLKVNGISLEQAKEKKALILGTGGAAKAVSYVLQKLGTVFQYVSRKENTAVMTYEQLNKEIISKNELIINTTPLGMAPNIETFPNIPYHYLNKKHLLYDLVYNPEETTFLKKGKTQGASIQNGLKMLYLQAEKAWEIWNKH